MRALPHAAAITAFAAIAAVIIFARPLNRTAMPAASLAGFQAVVFKK